MCIYTAVDFDVKFKVCQGATCAESANTCECVIAHVKKNESRCAMDES